MTRRQSLRQALVRRWMAFAAALSLLFAGAAFAPVLPECRQCGGWFGSNRHSLPPIRARASPMRLATGAMIAP